MICAAIIAISAICVVAVAIVLAGLIDPRSADDIEKERS